MATRSRYSGNSGGDGVVITVAASDSSASDKANADYVCTGTDDQIIIQQAIDALPEIVVQDANQGGQVNLTQGSFYITAAIHVKSEMTLLGTGAWSTNIIYNGTSGNVSAIEPYENTTCFFTTIEGIGLWGNKDGDVLLSGGTGCGIDGQPPSGGGLFSDLRVVNCWAAYWPETGFDAGNVWNSQLMYSTAEYCMGYGFKFFSEIIGSQMKYNRTGGFLAAGRYTEGMLQKNMVNGIYASNINCNIANSHFNANCRPQVYALNPAGIVVHWQSPYNGFISNWWKMTGVDDSNTDTGVIDECNLLYFKILDDTGGNFHLEFYKTTTGYNSPTYSDLVAHTGAFSGSGSIVVTADNASGIGGAITMTVPAGGFVESSFYAVSIPWSADEFQRTDLISYASNTRVMSNEFSSDTDGDWEYLAKYTCRLRNAGSTVNQTVIGNTIIDGKLTYAGIRVDGKGAMVANNIVSLLNVTGTAYGISYTSSTNPWIKDNHIISTAAQLTGNGLEFGANTDFAADNLIVAP